jgi:hypothetical protein
MEVEFLIEGLDPSEYLIKVVTGFVKDCIKQSRVSESDIDKILLADDDNYLKAIKQLDENETYTKNNMVVGMGKTIYRRNNNEYKNGIVLKRVIIEAPLEGNIKYKNIDEWEPARLEFLYVIHHELGHCYDNKTRNLIEYPKIFDENKLFKIKQVAEYYTAILLSDFFACVFSAYAAREKMIEYDCRNLDGYVIKGEKRIVDLKTKYFVDKNYLYELAFEVAGDFWFILMQYAKLVGFKIGNEVLSSVEIKVDSDVINKNIDILREFEKILNNCYKYYPNYDSKIHNFLFDIWNRLCLRCGYEFVEGLNSDALFFNIY